MWRSISITARRLHVGAGNGRYALPRAMVEKRWFIFNTAACFKLWQARRHKLKVLRAPRARDSRAALDECRLGRSVSALDELAALEALEVQRGLAACTSVAAAPADRKPARQPHLLFQTVHTAKDLRVAT